MAAVVAPFAFDDAARYAVAAACLTVGLGVRVAGVEHAPKANTQTVARVKPNVCFFFGTGKSGIVGPGLRNVSPAAK
jgi:hypothetical protein